ncbi:hypothetical protein MMC06_002006 [Schaereria dolodes]|nr:hypothetical protein [Schaereria dolodes]
MSAFEACLRYVYYVFYPFLTLYIYFGVAVIIGALAGALLHYISGFFITAFNFNAGTEERGRTLASYRALQKEKLARKARLTVSGDQSSHKAGGMLRDDYSEWSKHDKGLGVKGLLSTTILEEDDSSEAGF